jgi:hypothetical protein
MQVSFPHLHDFIVLGTTIGFRDNMFLRGKVFASVGVIRDTTIRSD